MNVNKIRRVRLVPGDRRCSLVFRGDEVGKRISYLHITPVRDTVACHHGDQARLREGGMQQVNTCFGAFFRLPCYITVLCILSHVSLVPYLALRCDDHSALLAFFYNNIARITICYAVYLYLYCGP